jgi:hypothetical protein
MESNEEPVEDTVPARRLAVGVRYFPSNPIPQGRVAKIASGRANVFTLTFDERRASGVPLSFHFFAISLFRLCDVL